MAQADKSILVVDDSETNLVLLEAVLEDKGWSIQTAKSGAIAMKMIDISQPDLILLDLLMPGIDGHEILKRLKSSVRLRDIPVIVISAVTDPEIIHNCLEKGAADYMFKPVRIEKLVKKVEEFLKGNE